MTKIMQEKSFAVHWILFKFRETFAAFVLSTLKEFKKAITQNYLRENLQNCEGFVPC